MHSDGNFIVYQKFDAQFGLEIIPPRSIFTILRSVGTTLFQLRANGRLTLTNPKYPNEPEWNSINDADGQESFLVLQDDGDLVAYKFYDCQCIQDDPKNFYFSIKKNRTGYRNFAVHNLIQWMFWPMPLQPILL